ncbi:hypothetical protein O3P69_015118 [Scylla paramamosain]|uniref:ALMS motif domain-containing protein n=1 Tax=Scylla paramamosain TaxID=85552 RepID=A0AAW0T3Q0_SCYPA
MSSNKEKQDGLPEIYLRPSYHPGQGHGAHTSSDTEPNAWEETDSESWSAVVPEVTVSSPPFTASSLCQREEIEGGSSLDMPGGGTSQERETENNSEGTQNSPEAAVLQTQENEQKTQLDRGRSQIPKQRGETPGSDCPPVAGITAFVRRFGQPLNLDTQTQIARSSELIFSPGGDQGFMLPGGVHAYYGSTSDIETLEWADNGSLTLVPIRDAVEGADAGPSPDQAMDSSVEDLERNSPAGLSTPDAEIDLSVNSGRRLVSKKPQKGIRPPAVGQSEEVLVQTSRKDLGSTDGEESEEEIRKKSQPEATVAVLNSAEGQLGSLGSQSENTDSLSTVLEMRRGEVQGCERDHASSTTTVSPALGTETSLIQPTFIVGGLISPRGKLRQFQDAVRGRMQDVKASLNLVSGSTDDPLDRQHYLNQMPLCPVIPPCEPEVSLASLVSVESTNPPESSDRVTSPSVLSVSSVASSKRMEWDSGADVGYLGTNTHVTPAASLSTLERIALGSYASVLRTEPEGTTQAKEKQRGMKKGGKSGTIKSSNKGTSSKPINDLPASSPLHSARTHHSRADKACLSSSEEDLSNKLSSPTQSPRRRLRRRALQTSPQDGDAPSRRSNRAMHYINRALKETKLEHHREGKSCSLVELATPAVSSSKCQRSNSQQSLPSVRSSHTRSSVSGVAERDSSGTVTGASWNKKGEQVVANTSTSTSTLVQSMSPLPVAGTSACTSVNPATTGVLQHQLVEKEHKSVTGDSRCSSTSSFIVHDKEYLHYQHGRPSWTSSGNDISSRSETSSPAWLPSHTDTESLTSRPLSTDELGDLKARKNSENAKNHEYMVRRGSSSDLESREVREDNSSSSPGHLTDIQNAAADVESTLENQVSLQSFNNALHALSVKLQEHIQALLDNGSLRKVQDYNKLQDYVRFVGIPSVTEEECQLRQGVAGVITRMFGEIAFDHPQVTTDTSNTFTSETSDSHTGDQRLPTPGTCEELDIPIPWSECGSKRDEQEVDSRKQGQQGSGGSEDDQCHTKEPEERAEREEQEKCVVEQDRCTTPGGTVVVVPYRPPSASRTYFMAVSHEWEAGLVEGEHVPAAGNADLSRGQAEGKQEERAPTASATPRLLSENSSINECDSEKLVDVEGATFREEDHKTVSSLPGDQYQLGRSQDISSPHSDSSPGHSNSSPLHTWSKEDPSGSQWWAGSGRCERLYQDRQGGLHVAHQPPGYTDDHDDSHPSESLSDHDHHHHRHHSGEPGRLPAHPWTSSGSESAYETIRERHRHVDEALASSFEFYSTSPRDARLLGYVSSEGQEEEERQRVESPVPPESSTRSDSATQSKTLSRPWQHQQQSESQNSTPSSRTDAQDVSSQISFIQLQKQKYVRKIQRHIHTLEKLEKALLDQLGDSIGSEGTFKQKVTRGNSGTGSDTTGNMHTHNLLGHSDTTTSSIMSSEDSTHATKKQKHLPLYLRKVSRSTHLSGQENSFPSNDGKEDTRLSQGPSGISQSYSSSPRVNISQLSSDVNSSRASTMKQVEDEVRKLASTEERSRRAVLQPHHSPRSWALHTHSKRIQRTELLGEGDPLRSGFSSQSAHSYSPEVTLSGQRRSSSAVESSAARTIAGGGSSSELHSVQALPISEESGSDLPALESQISRQGDGRESKENQVGKVNLTTVISGRTLTFKSPAAQGVAVSESPTGDGIVSKDFGQMFPSSEFIEQGNERKGESIGVQTGDSLLYAGKSSRKRGSRISVSSSERESTTESLKNREIWGKVKQSSHANQDTDYTKKHIGKSSHEKITNKIKPVSNRKYHAEKTYKSSEISKDKEMVKGMKNNKESRSKSCEQLSTASKKISVKLSKKETLSNKPVPSRKHKDVTKSRKEERARLGNRSVPFKDKPTPKSGSEDRTLSSQSSLSHSVESISLESCEHGGTSSGKAGSVQNEGEYYHSNDGNSFSTEYSKETEQHPQSDLACSISEDTSQSHHSPLGRQNYNKNGQSSIKEPIEGLKGGTEESPASVPPGWLLISPPVPKDRSKQKGKPSLINDGKSKSIKNLNNCRPSQSKIEEDLNRANLVKNHTQEEADTLITSKENGTPRLGEHTKPVTLKVGWVEDKQMCEQKKPVTFEVTFPKQVNKYVKSKPPAFTSTTTTFHSTKKTMTLQEALAMARPDYLREAGDRTALIRLKREMRQATQTQNHQVLAQLPPNLQTPSTLQRFLYKSDLGPLFSYKDIREQNQRLYSLLPEAKAPGARQHLSAVRHTNRLLANLYSQRLRKKVIQGRVSHAHKEVVTPLVHRVLQQ